MANAKAKAKAKKAKVATIKTTARRSKPASRSSAASRKPKSEAQSEPLQNMRTVERSLLPAALLAILDEHRYVVRVLKILDAEAKQLVDAKQPSFDSILSIMHYIGRQTDNFHHPKEDLIFERMSLEEGGLQTVVDTLVNQHRELGRRRRAIIRDVKKLQKKNAKREARKVSVAILEYSSLLLEHMMLEEREVFAVAYRDLAESDWRAIDRKMAPVLDPVFGPVKSSRYMELFERYINHTVSVSRGALPVGVVEIAASRVEKYISRSRQLSRKFWSLGGSDSDSAAGTEFGKVVNLDSVSDIDAIERGGGNDMLEGDARVSWQAIATNLFLRTALKPYLARLSIEGVSRLVKTPVPAFQVPGDLHSTPVRSKNFKANWVHNSNKPRTKRTILYLPGGGFIFPASSFHYRALHSLADSLDARGMLVNYRLAPEHPFPAGLEDAIAAYRFLVEEQGVAPNEIIIAGDSAGGGLTLSLLLSIRELGLPMPLCASVFSPFTDVSFSSPSMKYNRWLDPMLPTGEHMDSFEVYIGETDVADPLVSPVHGSFTGLPPILAQVSSTETLLDDTLRVARNARAQDAKFEVEVWQGLPHCWQIFTFLPESKFALRHVVDFVRKQMPAESEAAPKAARKLRRKRKSAA